MKLTQNWLLSGQSRNSPPRPHTLGVGTSVGPVGVFVGLVVGSLVGELVGLDVGARVGALVGALVEAVGAFVGAAVFTHSLLGEQT